MAYIGNGPGVASQRVLTTLTATDGQTTFVPTSGYTLGYVDVYFNGVKLIDGSDYTASNGVNIVLTEAATAGDIVEVVTYFPRGLSDGYTKAEADARYYTQSQVDSAINAIDLTAFNSPVQLKNYTTTQRNALTGLEAGDTIYNSTTGSIEFYDGANWIATNLIPTVSSVTGNIYAGAASTLTLGITNATESVTVRFSEGGVTVEDVADVTVTSGSASVTVPAAVYGQTAGDTIVVTILNQDGTPASNSISKTVLAPPSGGTITTFGDYRVHTFTSSGTFTVPAGQSLTTDILLVAGGGGGSSSGGGGAGGVLYSTSVAASSGSHSVTVGAGGAGAASGTATLGANGVNSTALSLTAIGGGYGGAYRGDSFGNSGGSGGGGGHSDGTSTSVAGGSGTSGQGYAGGSGDTVAAPWGAGGGGGAGGAGGNFTNSPAPDQSGHGGVGRQVNIDGNNYYWGGGGGGGAQGYANRSTDNSDWDTSAGNGGLGGGGGGGVTYNTYGVAGTGGGSAINSGNSGVSASGAVSNTTQVGGDGGTNSGGGGGGQGITVGSSGAGGSGIVIIRYQL